MAGQSGFLYEKKLNDKLKKAGLEDKSFQSAGSDKNAPDALLTYQDQDYKLELKLDLKVDFGQGSLVWDVKWTLGGGDTDSSKQMQEFLTQIGALKIVNRVWGPKGAPRKGTVPLDRFMEEDVDSDYRRFRDEKISVSSDAIANYYASKKTYYIQIGGKGLYYMGKDPANFGCKEFKPDTILRIRLKRGGSHPIYNYRFSTALRISMLEPSNIDLDDEKDLMAIAARAKT